MEDQEMDAPQISTLTEDMSPPPQQSPVARVSKFRVKLRLPEQGMAAATSNRDKIQSKDNPETAFSSSSLVSSSPMKKSPTGDSEEDDEEDDEEEEDQLADDDDGLVMSNLPSSATSTPARGSPSKPRGARQTIKIKQRTKGGTELIIAPSASSPNQPPTDGVDTPDRKDTHTFPSVGKKKTTTPKSTSSTHPKKKNKPVTMEDINQENSGEPLLTISRIEQPRRRPPKGTRVPVKRFRANEETKKRKERFGE